MQLVITYHMKKFKVVHTGGIVCESDTSSPMQVLPVPCSHTGSSLCDRMLVNLPVLGPHPN